MSLMKTFTQGGQVTLHNVRMIKQVINITIIGTLVLGALFWIGKSYFDYTPHQRYIIKSYYWAEIKMELPLSLGDKETQFFERENGHKSLVFSKDIINQPRIKALVTNFEDQVTYNAIISLILMGSIFLIMCGFWIKRGNAKKEKEILSGTEIVTPEDLTKLIKSHGEASTFTLAKIPLIKDKEKQHTLVIGTTGSGKTNCFNELLMQVRAKKQRAVIVDLTGVFIEKYYRPGIDKILNPLDERSEAWSLWSECPQSYHLKAITSVLIPEERGGEESFWTKSSRILFTTTAELLLSQNGTITTAEFQKYATEYPLSKIQKFYAGSKAASLASNDAKETAAGVRANLQSNIEALTFFKDVDYPFSIREWVTSERGDEWLFLSLPPEMREALAQLLSLWTTVATDSLMSLDRSDERRLWFVIDELPGIRRIPKLHTALAEVRKYGGCYLLGAQDMSLLDEIYGYNHVKSIANLCSTKVIFRIEGSEIAERMSKWLGIQETLEFVENISYGAHQMRDGVSLNDQRREKPTVNPDKLMKLPNLEAYLKLPGNYPIAQIKFAYCEPPSVSKGFVAKNVN